MSEIGKKHSFRVPKDYFDSFEEKMLDQIDSKVSEFGFTTPKNYFEKVERDILSRVNYPSGSRSVLKYMYRAAAVAAILIAFIYNENNQKIQYEMTELFIEEYIIGSSTYEIADYTDFNGLSVETLLNSYVSTGIEGVLDSRLYGENPTNLNILDDE